MSIDLSQLPAPLIVEPLDFETVVSAMQADLVARGQAIGIDFSPVLALESEPLTKLIEVAAYRELQVRASFNARAQGALLAYAQAGDLDNVALNLDVRRQAGELDPAFRARALLAPDGWSTAGPKGAYKFHALSADPSILDADVTSPAPGQVRVALLTSAAGGLASPALVAQVLAALSADSIRPLTDQVSVVSGAAQPYNVTATLFVAPGPDPAPVVAAASAAVQAYAAARYRLRTALPIAGLIGALMQPGVDNLALVSPAADIPAAGDSAPQLGSLALTVSVEAASG